MPKIDLQARRKVEMTFAHGHYDSQLMMRRDVCSIDISCRCDSTEKLAKEGEMSDPSV